MRAARDTSSISSTRSRRSSAIVTIASASGGFTPQTTDDPPPNGTITWPLLPHQSTVAVELGLGRRVRDHIGRVRELEVERPACDR